MALAKAYEGQINTIVSYFERKNRDMNIKEVGSVWTDGAAFAYATYFTRNDLSYVYEISFVLQYYGSEKAEPSDSEYINTYNQIVSSFKFID